MKHEIKICDSNKMRHGNMVVVDSVGTRLPSALPKIAAGNEISRKIKIKRMKKTYQADVHTKNIMDTHHWPYATPHVLGVTSHRLTGLIGGPVVGFQMGRVVVLDGRVASRRCRDVPRWKKMVYMSP
jgi:hypothetical protein